MKTLTLSSFVASLAVVAALGTTAAHAEKTKFEFWYGLSGDLGERVQDACKKFNASQPIMKSSAPRKTAMTRRCRTRLPRTAPRSTPPSRRFMMQAR